MPPTIAKPSSHPAWPPRLAPSRRNGPGSPPKTLPPPPPPGPAPPPPCPTERLRAAGLAVDAAEAVVADDQAEDAVVARPRHPRAVGRGREEEEQRARPPVDAPRRAAGEQLAARAAAPARGDPQVRRD